jgi:hypothetical protein
MAIVVDAFEADDVNGNDETFRGIRNFLYYCFANVSFHF